MRQSFILEGKVPTCINYCMPFMTYIVRRDWRNGMGRTDIVELLELLVKFFMRGHSRLNFFEYIYHIYIYTCYQLSI